MTNNQKFELAGNVEEAIGKLLREHNANGTLAKGIRDVKDAFSSNLQKIVDGMKADSSELFDEIHALESEIYNLICG